MMLVGFIPSSMLQGKNTFTLGAAVTHSNDAKTRSAGAEQQPKLSHEPVEGSSR